VTSNVDRAELVGAQIAGMALEERLPVLTRNAKLFERV
jgi:predicted nucleic acid-binding protein